MSDLYYSVNLSNRRTLCIGPAVTREIETAIIRPKRSDEICYYLYETDTEDLDAGIKILAKFVSEDAAIRLGSMLNRRLGPAEAGADLLPA